MSAESAAILEKLFVCYLTAGCYYAVYFIGSSFKRRDRALHGSPFGLRFLFFPAATAFWPLLSIVDFQMLLRQRRARGRR
ncbi:MAG: hypothetical protein K1X75_01645 [Leptospirales bacterium]|nr:hypothetical protein [Leptospirales bacterium]